MRHYCTYFDRNYGSLGLALHHSLVRHGGEFTLWILCLDDECHRVLAGLGLPRVRLIRLEEFEEGDDALLAAKANRSRIEYYFTCTPSLPRFVFRREPAADLVTYLDADLFFYSSPEAVFAELGSRSVGIIAHRFAPGMEQLRENGIYNVGWVSFRRDRTGLACLEWWRDRCLEWCYQRHEEGRYGDQKYLDDWPARFPGTAVIANPGANAAMWNLANHRVTCGNGAVKLDGADLVFFHFHGLRRIGRGIFKLNAAYYGVNPNRCVLWEIFAPYLRVVRSFERGPNAPFPARPVVEPGPRSVIDRLRFPLHVAANVARGNYIVCAWGHIVAAP